MGRLRAASLCGLAIVIMAGGALAKRVVHDQAEQWPQPPAPEDFWGLPDGLPYAQQTTPPIVPATAPPLPAAPQTGAQSVPTPLTPANPETEPPVAPAEPAATPENPDELGDDFSLGDIPVVETIELKVDTARKAIDAYVLVREKFKDAELENYENLQDFVDAGAVGKAFEADIKAAGFANVNDWNTTVTTISFAYANVVDDQTDDIKLQIEEIKTDTDMAQDMRERMILALNAMIPSDNNRKIIEEMLKDPVYADKVKLLETEEE